MFVANIATNAAAPTRAETAYLPEDSTADDEMLWLFGRSHVINALNKRSGHTPNIKFETPRWGEAILTRTSFAVAKSGALK